MSHLRVFHIRPTLATFTYTPALITVQYPVHQFCPTPMSPISILYACLLYSPPFMSSIAVLCPYPHYCPPFMFYTHVFHFCPRFLSNDSALISALHLCPPFPTSTHVFCFCFTLVSSSCPISLLSLLLSNTLVFLLVLHPVPLLSSDERRMILLYLRFKIGSTRPRDEMVFRI